MRAVPINYVRRVSATRKSICDFVSDRRRRDEDTGLDQAHMQQIMLEGRLGIPLYGISKAKRQSAIPCGLRFNVCRLETAYSEERRGAGTA